MSLPQPILRPYEPRFHEGFRALVLRTHAEFGFSYDPGLDADLDSPADFYDPLILLLNDGEVVGSAALRPVGRDAELKRMYLDPEFRRQGQGRRLLKAVLAAARRQGCKRIWLDTSERQTDAGRLYEAAGFRQIDERPGPGGSRTVLYELDLGGADMELSESDDQELRELEESLWRSETRFDRDYMEVVLAPDFFEFGRSGRVYSREDTLRLGAGPIEATFPLADWSVRALDGSTVQATYAIEVRRAAVERARRSSIWSKTDAGWQLRFHQGTPID